MKVVATPPYFQLYIIACYNNEQEWQGLVYFKNDLPFVNSNILKAKVWQNKTEAQLLVTDLNTDPYHRYKVQRLLNFSNEN